MNDIVNDIKKCLNCVEAFFASAPNERIYYKPKNNKWSKIEILGHLIDSGIHNLNRFNEAQYLEKPYKVLPYNQDALVTANNYQEAEILELLGFWLSINTRIMEVVSKQTDETLRYEIEVDGNLNYLKFLILDYVTHMKHHVYQIVHQ